MIRVTAHIALSHLAAVLVGLVATSLLLSAGPTAAQPPDSVRALWQEGTQAYAQGRYAQATEAYLNILNAGFESGALHYNLGNTYYRLGEPGEAVQHYEKAKRFRPDDARIDHNLDMLRSEFDALSGASPASGWLRLVKGWPTEALFWFGLSVYAAGVLAWSWMYSTSQDKPAPAPRVPIRRLALAATASGLLIVTVAGATGYAQTLDRRAVVLVDNTSLRAEPGGTTVANTDPNGANPDAANPDAANPDAAQVPSGSAADASRLVEGTIVRLRTSRSGWTRVTGPDGQTGWLPSSDLGEI